VVVLLRMIHPLCTNRRMNHYRLTNRHPRTSHHTAAPVLYIKQNHYPSIRSPLTITNILADRLTKVLLISHRLIHLVHSNQSFLPILKVNMNHRHLLLTVLSQVHTNTVLNIDTNIMFLF
jgi:hypothetical protein